MSSFAASAINPRQRGKLARSLYTLGFSLATAVLSTQAYAGCQYVVSNQWNEGFSGVIKITNSGTTAISGWTVGWQYSGGDRITSSFNATLSGTNPYSATNLSWNGSIAPNQSVEFGFQGTKGVKGATTAEIPQITGTVCGSTTTSSVASSASSAARSSVVASSVASVPASSVASSSKASVVSNSSVSNGAGVFVTDGFESGSVGAAPAGWSNFIGWVFNNNNTLSSGNYALIDNSKSYSGTNSIHFRGGANPAQIVRALPSGMQRLHMRAYVNMSKAMGNQAGDNHEHIMGLKKTQDANDEIRVGQIKGVLGTNHIPSDNIAPKMSQWYSGPQMAANTWYCVETAYYADTSYDQLYMWVNGTLVHSITSSSDWNNGALGADWLSDKFNYAMLGFHSFSNNTADVWMDDIVLSTQPIGCGAVTTSSASSVASSIRSSSSVASSVVSSVASSVRSSSSVVSSVASSIAVSSASARSSVASSVASSANANAAWDLDTTTSYFNFVTTKNTQTVEAHNFTTIGGYIGNNGVAVLTIDLNTVNTNNTVRDQRMRDYLFEVLTYPTATVSVTVPSTLLSSLSVGQAATTEITATVDLHGVSFPVTTRVSVQKLSSSRILVQSLSPVLTKAADYNLTSGVETLRSLVGASSISAAVPVDFALVFNAR
jgi:polyisoprenoid-binding protein YceI